MVAYYDKCCGWYQGMHSYLFFYCILTPVALVTRTGNQPDDRPRLKTAADLAANGDLREIVEKIWASESSGLDEVSFKVRSVSFRISG